MAKKYCRYCEPIYIYDKDGSLLPLMKKPSIANNIYINSGMLFEVIFTRNSGVQISNREPIAYCPMCGKKIGDLNV